MLNKLFEASRLTDEDLDPIYDRLIHRGVMDISEIKDLVNDMDYHRGPFSAQLSFIRMHGLIHGVLPNGLFTKDPESEKAWFDAPKTMYDYLLRRGDFDEEDLHQNRISAKADMRTRRRPPNEREAVDIMSKYFYQNIKDNYPKPVETKVIQNRKNIVGDLVSGMSPEQAFGQYLNESKDVGSFLDFLNETLK